MKPAAVFATIMFMLCAAALLTGCGNGVVETESFADKMSSLAVGYDMDGGGDSDITGILQVRQWVRVEKEALIPLLIESLDSTKESAAFLRPEAENQGKPKISTGYVCFDLLCEILKKNDKWFDSTCGDDGIWAAVRAEYSIPMNSTGAGNLQAIRARWQRLYDDGLAAFDPDCLKNFDAHD